MPPHKSKTKYSATPLLGLCAFVTFILSLGFSGCTNPSKDSPTAVATQPAAVIPESDGKQDSTKSKFVITGPNARELCVRPKSIVSDPRTIEDVIRLLNAMPKPVSVACLLDVFERPLYLNATSNFFSGQPAEGSDRPRIFLFLGSYLLVSVVPTGTGAEVIEFGYKTDESRSVKGELKFPVTETLALDAAYTYILEPSGKATVCRACHSPEEPAPEGFPPTALTSRFVRPSESYDVSVRSLEQIHAACAATKSEECEVIQSIFIQGEVFPKSF